MRIAIHLMSHCLLRLMAHPVLFCAGNFSLQQIDHLLGLKNRKEKKKKEERAFFSPVGNRI